MPALPTTAKIVCRDCGTTVHPRHAHVCDNRVNAGRTA